MKNLKDYKLKQKAAQTWCSTMAFHFLVDDWVPDDDVHLSVISNLLNIRGIIFSSSNTVEELEYLHDIINDHIYQLKYIFPNCHLINKHHNLLHHANSMRQNGPLINYWCMRYEAKHYHLKQRAAACRNFTNIWKTVGEQH